MEKIAIFADVQNIYYTVNQKFKRNLNYQIFWQQATANREVMAAYAYAIDRDDSKQRGFQQKLRQIGFEVKLKPFIQRSDGSTKGDWDVGIALDLIEWAESVDTVILVSGDGDFDLALVKARDRFNTSSEVYGVQDLTAGSLIRACDIFIPIEENLLI